MFKLKVKNIKRSEALNTLSLIESNNYKYVLADDISLFEDDKINILIKEEYLKDIKLLIQEVSRGEDLYINVENSFGTKRINVRMIE